jgi:antitoxin VapB
LTPSAEHDDKLQRLGRVAADAGLGGIVLAAHHNIAWLTSGRHNRVDASREAGSARLLVTADGRRFVLANAIEMPRMLDEVLTGLDYEPVEYPLTDDQTPAQEVHVAASLAGGAKIGADWPLPAATIVEGAIARARVPLTDGEIARYRALGAEAGRVMGDVCRPLTPGDDERDISRAVIDGAASIRARAVVSLVGSDERLRRYRHPVPAPARWKHVVMLALCAERDGLVVSLSRIVAAAPPAELAPRTRAAASVLGCLLDATRPGAKAADLYTLAADAYRAAGFPGEELKHHQGGAIGYRAREWVAHPRSQNRPSAAGVRVEPDD